MSNFKTILESKIGSDITKLGEDTLTKLSELALSDEQFTEISSKLLGITEAENNPTIIGKNKDAWHKAEFKSVLDSFDSSLQGHEGIIEVMPTNTKDKVKEVLKSYKTKYESLQRENADLTQKAKEGFSDAELKALLKAKEEEVSTLKTTHIPKDSVKEYENQEQNYFFHGIIFLKIIVIIAKIKIIQNAQISISAVCCKVVVSKNSTAVHDAITSDCVGKSTQLLWVNVS